MYSEFMKFKYLAEGFYFWDNHSFYYTDVVSQPCYVHSMIFCYFRLVNWFVTFTLSFRWTIEHVLTIELLKEKEE